MQQLPPPLAALSARPQFVLWKAVHGGPKIKKVPISPHTCVAFEKGADWQSDPTQWTDAATACMLAAALGPEYGVGFLFTAADPFFFLDIDGALAEDGRSWAPWALELCEQFRGAAVEVSTSGTGLHIIGWGTPTLPTEQRRKKSPCNRLELYTERRFVALTGTGALGDAGHAVDQQQLDALVAAHFAKPEGTTAAEWTEEPDARWSPLTDEEIVERALRSTSGAAAFGGRASFRDLWERNVDALARHFPDPEGNNPYDQSRADGALAQHLAFWTGNNCDAVLRFMWQSGLVREKWNREDYLERTILGAVGRQTEVYGLPPAQEVADHGAGKLRGSDLQLAYAEPIRAQKLTEVAANPEAQQRLAAQKDASFWLDNKDKTGEQLAAMLTPVAAAAPAQAAEPTPRSGYQYLGGTQQLELFAGCHYVQDLDRILTARGDLLKQSQFNAMFGGWVFQLDELGKKTTRKAWEAFTESQLYTFPKMDGICFRPAQPPNAHIVEDGRSLVNTYRPAGCGRTPGDVSPFLNHLAKLFPNETDRTIITSYLAALVQHPGVKFQWAPVVQGTEGNGKTLIFEAMARILGERYTHTPDAESLKEKFNGWVEGRVLCCVEEIHVRGRVEIADKLKPLITNRRISVEKKGVDQYTGDNCSNFLMFSQHKDAVLKTKNDRRYAVFFTPQQTADDIDRDDMGGNYFPNLYAWLRGDGAKHIAHYLESYQIPEQYNPATLCHRAPETSATDAAIQASEGSVEQEIREAIAEERPGFAGGWISSIALDQLLQDRRMGRAVAPNKRRDLLNSLGFDYHPALRDGRATSVLPSEGNKKPRLYIAKGHVSGNLDKPGDAVAAYLKAQGYAPLMSATKAG